MTMTAEETSPLLARTDSRPPTAVPEGADEPLDFSPEDPENPQEWSRRIKLFIVIVLAVSAFNVTWTCIIAAPIANRIVADLSPDEPSKTAQVLLVTIWELGEAAGPLLIAPLSELLGRRSVINTCNILAVAATVLATLAQSTEAMISSRFLSGLSVTSNVLNPAIIGDMFPPEERGSAMSMLLFAPLLGSTLGPSFGGFVADVWHWRYVFLMCTVITVLCAVVFLAGYRETYKLAILRRRRKAMTAMTGIKFKGPETGRKQAFLQALARPGKVMFSSGVFMALSVYNAVVFSYIYVVAVSIPGIIEDVYGFSSTKTGMVFITNGVGSVFSILITKTTVDRVYVKLKHTHGGIGQPEFRLPTAIFGTLMLGPAAMLYGWSAQLVWPLPVCILAMVLIRIGLLLALLPVTAYFVDASGIYAASAMTGLVVTRCLGGAFLPLATEAATERFGYGWAFTMYGGLTLALLVVPVSVYYRGEQWRKRSIYTDV